MIKIYCSETNVHLFMKQEGEPYCTMFPENLRHPKQLRQDLNYLLDSMRNTDINIITHSKLVINMVIDWVMVDDTFNHESVQVIFIYNNGDELISNLDDDYCLEKWDYGLMDG